MKLKEKMHPEARTSFQIKNDYVENKIENVFNYYKNAKLKNCQVHKNHKIIDDDDKFSSDSE